MPEFDSPDYILALEQSRNRDQIADAKPGQRTKVFVVPAGAADQTPIVAEGVLEGDTFVVTVTTSEGTQRHQWPWQLLRGRIAALRKAAKRAAKRRG